MKSEKEDTRQQLDNRSLYDVAIGKKLDEQELESEEFNQAQDQTFHQEWLQHPNTVKLLSDTKYTLGKILDVAMACAKAGQDQAAIRHLLKANALKEVIDYATRRNNKN